jgi:hypothetical protein
MADTENGAPNVDQPTKSKSQQEIVKEIGDKVLVSLRNWYTQEAPTFEVDQVLLNRVIGVCLSQYGAILAVDCGIPKDNFLKSQEILFDAAYREAPKFG